MKSHSIQKDLIIPGQKSFETICNLVNEISCSKGTELFTKILGEICKYTGTDGIILYSHNKKNKNIILISSKFNEKVHLQDYINKNEIQLPHLRELLFKDKITKVEQLSQLPENASYEKNFLQKVNIKSFLVLPFMAQHEFYGAFAFSITNHRWEKKVVTYLNLVGKVLSNALTRLEQFEKYEEISNKFKTIADNTFSMEKWRSSNGKLLYISPSCKRLTGFLPEDFYSGRICMEELVMNEDQEFWRYERNKFSEIESNAGIEYRIRSKDKKVKWILETGMRVVDENNIFLGWRSSFLDISEKKELEKELIEIKNKVEIRNAELSFENELLKRDFNDLKIPGFITSDPNMLQILEKVKQVAYTDSPVLISGETGTGKELIAKAIHQLSKRKSKPLVTVNCGAIPSALIESELFGREKGAYTGALSKQVGRFQLANQSSIFLDEIGELPFEVQSKLLRVLQFGELQMLGSPVNQKVNIRLIAATNRNLQEEISSNKFRKDLFYRINVFPINIPALRERKGDIPLLVWEFVKEFSQKMGKRIRHVRATDMEKLIEYSWPGNLRELRNIIEYSMILTKSSTLNVELHHNISVEHAENVTLQEIEKNHILKVLKQTGWKIRGKNGAAEILGINEATLRYRMKKLGIERNSL